MPIAVNRPGRRMVLLWLSVVLVLLLSEAVLMLDRSCDCIIPPRSTRGQGKLLQLFRGGTKFENSGIRLVPQVVAISCTRIVR